MIVKTSCSSFYKYVQIFLDFYTVHFYTQNNIKIRSEIKKSKLLIKSKISQSR